MKKRKRYLLVLVCVLGILWLLCLGYYNLRAFSVTTENLHQRFHNRIDSDRVTPGEAQGHHLLSDQKQFSAKNKSLEFVYNIHNATVHVISSIRADITQTSGHLYTVTPPALPVKHGHGNVHVMGINRDNIRQGRTDRNVTDYLTPKWLQSDDSRQQILLKQNDSRSGLKHKLMEAVHTTPKIVHRPRRPVDVPLLASGHRPSGYFQFDVQHSADRYSHVVLSVVDSGFIHFAINFQRLCIDAIGLQNFLFVCTDRQAVALLQQHGIACSYFQLSTTVQVAHIYSFENISNLSPF